jgi:hypothetical protein
VRRELVLVPPTARESETAAVRARDERDTRGTRARRVRGRRVAEAASAKRREHGKEASGVANDSREEEEGPSVDLRAHSVSYGPLEVQMKYGPPLSQGSITVD